MYWYVEIIVFVIVVKPGIVNAPPPLRLTIDCGSNEKNSRSLFKSRSTSIFDSDEIDVNSFCALIHKAIPKAIHDGKFILIEPDEDQSAFGDAQLPVFVEPPTGFVLPKLPRLRVPKLRVPKISVPKLVPPRKPQLGAPKIGHTMRISRLKEEESSAEKMEKFKKGVRKMLHFVKVLGQVDQYLSERTRIIVEKLSKTLGE